MEINRTIDNSEPLEPNPPRSELLYYKSEEDLDQLRQVGGGFDRLLQVGGGFGSTTECRRRIWIVYDKSEEDWDRLLQVGGGFGSSATSRRRTSQHPSKGSHLPRLLGLHQQRQSW
jgi:hypothetical protein